MPKFELVEFPGNTVANVPEMLRNLADSIENNELGTVQQLAYVIDTGCGVMDVGLLGKSVSPGPEAYLLFACAQKHILRDLE